MLKPSKERFAKRLRTLTIVVARPTSLDGYVRAAKLQKIKPKRPVINELPIENFA